MFKIYVRPILEYNSCCWSPHLLKDIDLVESVQRSFTRRIRGLSDYGYKERLKICDLQSLEMRRMQEDMILTYKIVHNLIDLDFSKFFKFVYTENTRGHAFKLYPLHCRTSLALWAYNNRVVNVWNALPDTVVGARCLDVFKELVKQNESFFEKYLRGRALI